MRRSKAASTMSWLDEIEGAPLRVNQALIEHD